MKIRKKSSRRIINQNRLHVFASIKISIKIIRFLILVMSYVDVQLIFIGMSSYDAGCFKSNGVIIYFSYSQNKEL